MNAGIFTTAIKRLFARAVFRSSRNPETPPALAAQQKLLRHHEIKCIFDIGASDGPYTFKYRGLFPSAQVWAFEALGKHFEELVANTKSYPAIRPFHLAISDVNGPLVLNVNQLPHTSSILTTYPEKVAGAYEQYFTQVGRETVDSVTLDRFAESHNIQTIDILKMDIQGAELRALQGAARLLSERRISLIYCEVNFREFYDDQPLFADVAKHLHSAGYRLVDIYNQEYQGSELQWADAIFLGPHIGLDTSVAHLSR